LIFVAELESELLDVQIDPWSHKLADSGASWSIELYRAEGSRSQCDRLWGWGAEVQIGTGLRSLVPPVQRGRKCFSQRRPISVMHFQFDFLSGSHCFVVSIIQSLPLRTSERFRQRRRITPTRSEVARRIVSIGMGGHSRGSRTGWRDAVEHDDQHIAQQRGAHCHRCLVVRRYDIAAGALTICDGERREGDEMGKCRRHILGTRCTFPIDPIVRTLSIQRLLSTHLLTLPSHIACHKNGSEGRGTGRCDGRWIPFTLHRADPDREATHSQHSQTGRR
jgi:hypothetical protein